VVTPPPADSVPEPEPVPARGRRHGRTSRRRWPLVTGGVALLALLVVAVAGLWLYHQASSARSSLDAARASVSTLRADLRRGDVSQVTPLVTQIRRNAEAARSDTRGPLWSLAGGLPFLGTDVGDARAMADTVDGIARVELPSLATAVTALTPSKLRQADGSFDVAALQQAEIPVTNALAAVASASTRVDGLGNPHLGSLRSARTQLAAQLTGLQGDLTGADHALDVLVPMLGNGSTPRTYFVAFQNAAESRGTGGLTGTFAVLQIVHGKPNLVRTGSDSDLIGDNGGSHDVPVDLPSEYESTWGPFDPTGDWRNINIDPNFPYTGQIAAAKFAVQFHTRVDGVLAMDPFVLAALVGPQGSIALPDGTQVTGAQLPGYMLNTLYAKFATNQTARKTYLTRIVSVAFAKFQHAALDAGLLTRLEDAARDGHVQVWSAHPAEEQAVLKTEVSGAVPQGPGPFAFFSTVNTAGNKADYFLDRSLTYSASGCPSPGGTRTSRITVRLTNRLPVGQPPVVGGRFDTNPPNPLPPGQTQDLVTVFTAQGSLVSSSTLNGQSVDLDAGIERGHPTYQLLLELPRNETQTLVINLIEPAAGPVRVWRPAPLPRPEALNVSVPTCS
jgi:hypothetical protein